MGTRLKYSPYDAFTPIFGSDDVEQSFGGPLGTLIAGLGMGGYYIGLTWINILLGILLTPLFLIPLTWVQDAMAKKKGGE
jgi:hypothetical protein